MFCLRRFCVSAHTVSHSASQGLGLGFGSSSARDVSPAVRQEGAERPAPAAARRRTAKNLAMPWLTRVRRTRPIHKTPTIPARQTPPRQYPSLGICSSRWRVEPTVHTRHTPELASDGPVWSLKPQVRSMYVKLNRKGFSRTRDLFSIEALKSAQVKALSRFTS